MPESPSANCGKAETWEWLNYVRENVSHVFFNVGYLKALLFMGDI